MAFIRDSLSTNTRIVAAKAVSLSLYTNHITIPLSALSKLDSAAFWTAMRRDSADYVLLGSLHALEAPILSLRLAESCAALELVASFPPRTYLFRVKTPPVARFDSMTIDTRAVLRSNHVACDALASYRAQVPAE